MGASKGNYLAMLLIVFVLFLSLTSVIFRFSGAFFRAELVIWLILGLLAIIFLNALSSGSSWAWPAFFIFFVFHFINIFAVYSRTFQFKELAIPIVVCIIGLYMSAVKTRHEDEEDLDYDYSSQADSAEEKEIFTNVPEEKPKRKSGKKSSRKKK